MCYSDADKVHGMPTGVPEMADAFGQLLLSSSTAQLSYHELNLVVRD